VVRQLHFSSFLLQVVASPLVEAVVAHQVLALSVLLVAGGAWHPHPSGRHHHQPSSKPLVKLNDEASAPRWAVLSFAMSGMTPSLPPLLLFFQTTI
jgi:hypothetical protein